MGKAIDGTRPIIRFEGIGKRYSNGTQALSGVSFDIFAGHIHAICGENGAGKSTLMKILFGLEQPTAGIVHVDGEAVSIASARAAARLGIAMVHQHFSLVASLTVAENILLGQEPRRGLFIDRKEARRRVVALSKRYNLDVDPDARIGTLSVAAQQKVEILKALSRDGVRVLILDEPTAVLTPLETDELFQRLRDLQQSGLTILFISHKLREVRALSDHVTTLRLGQVSGDSPMNRISDTEIAALVMGAVRPAAVARGARVLGDVRVAVQGTAPGGRQRRRPAGRYRPVDTRRRDPGPCRRRWQRPAGARFTAIRRPPADQRHGCLGRGNRLLASIPSNGAAMAWHICRPTASIRAVRAA